MHATRDFARPRAIQFWTLHAGRGNASLQDAMGWQGRAALVVRAVLEQGCDNPLAARFPFSLWSASMASPSGIDRDGRRTFNRPLHTVSWRWQPPALSPISARSLASGLAAASGLLPRDDDRVVRILCERYDASDALLTDSGTSALVLALLAVGPPGGTVAYPDSGCIDLTAGAVRAGIHVRLYDLDPTTLSPDLDSVGRVISRGVDAIVVAHLYGYPADVEAVR